MRSINSLFMNPVANPAGVWLAAAVFAATAAVAASVSAESPPPNPPSLVDAIHEPLPFDGLGLDGFDGTRSIAQELRQWQAARHVEESWNLGMTVAGPGGTTAAATTAATTTRLGVGQVPPSPLKATVKSKVQGLDVQAEMNGDAEAIRSGQARWIGGVGMATEGNHGRAELALRTSVRYAEAARLIGFELGPRYERSLPGGLTFFLDGTAQAETAPSSAQRVWTPPVSAFEGANAIGFGSLGIAGRTGIVR